MSLTLQNHVFNAVVAVLVPEQRARSVLGQAFSVNHVLNLLDALASGDAMGYEEPELVGKLQSGLSHIATASHDELAEALQGLADLFRHQAWERRADQAETTAKDSLDLPWSLT